jgi:hypothetical protein
MKTRTLPSLLTPARANAWRATCPTPPLVAPPLYSPADSVAYIERQMWGLLAGMGVLLAAAAVLG